MRNVMHEIIPAILSETVDDFMDKFNQLNGLTDWLQVDIADGKFVERRTIEIQDLLGIRARSKLEFHLMVEQPESYLSICKQADARRIIFHLEASEDPRQLLSDIKAGGIEAGIALRPSTPVTDVAPYLNDADLVLLLGVNPGAQGQKFMTPMLNKIEQLRSLSGKIKIEVDGGVNLNNIVAIARAGADCMAIGSAILKSNDIPGMIDKFIAKI